MLLHRSNVGVRHTVPATVHSYCFLYPMKMFSDMYTINNIFKLKKFDDFLKAVFSISPVTVLKKFHLKT